MENNKPKKQKQQERVHRFLSDWKKKKAEEEKEAEESFKTPQYQAMLEQLRKENAAKGIVISG